MSTQVATPTESREFEPRNRLLAALSRADLLSLRPHLQPLLPEPGSILLEADEPLTRVYFVETGVVSLVTVLENRTSAGVAMVGREGLIGITTLLGGDIALGRHLVHVPGSVLALEVSHFRTALRASSKLRAACETYVQAFIFQVLHAAACYRLHTVEQRCARWLLMCADRTEDAGFQLTQERLAEMLGVRRPMVTAIAHTLQQTGLICGRRGAFTVLDRRGLEAAACECYRIVRDRYERLLARTCD
jgi:CRP-like cAMP-binding protein